jgi:HK97 family phage prohead protease
MNKTFALTVKAQRQDGGTVVISTPSLDRDKDRVDPMGARLEAYHANPVVCFGHLYREPWAVVGRTRKLDVSPAGLVADFELRPPANDADPQTIVRLLWGGGWLRSASIGFTPIRWTENDQGGKDYHEWELLEWSLTPVPAQADALALAVKALARGDGGTVHKGRPDWDLVARKQEQLDVLRADYDRLLAGVARLTQELNAYLRGGL